MLRHVMWVLRICGLDELRANTCLTHPHNLQYHHHYSWMYIPSFSHFYYFIILFYIRRLLATTIFLYKLIFRFLSTADIEEKCYLSASLSSFIHQGYWDDFQLFSVPNRRRIHHQPLINVHDDYLISTILCFYSFIRLPTSIYLIKTSPKIAFFFVRKLENTLIEQQP